ncbi:MAG: hypothetical protein F2555_02185 [Actinobacteria bacterium]|uniref:Unannotated protein n=1 Tax=freshwater metagenome TaxID=449393 RepID=A0A6J6DVD7_9ZZZZ|nr:hypothetical protein [Actinomycetota bacterium]
MDEQFIEHLSGIYTDLMDLKPLHQEYRTDVLIKEDDEVSLFEFIKAFYAATGITKDEMLIGNDVYFDEYYELDFDYEQHPEVIVPYGPAFLAMLGDPKLVTEFDLHLHENPGIRLIVAHMSKNVDVLDLLSYDRCCMVRAVVAENMNTGDRALKMLGQDPFIYSREIALKRLVDFDPMSPDLVNGFEISECVCNEQIERPSLHDFFDEHGLEIPATVQIFEEQATEFGDWHWATQPFPTRWQDYSLLETVEYLKGPIPDQYSLNHAGHGVNSYSLNFRFALGDLAIFAQTGWGGAYMDSDEQMRAWEEIEIRLSTIMLNAPVSGFDSSYIRKYLIVYSNFRINGAVEFWQHTEGQWTQLEQLNSLDAIQEYLESEYEGN